MTEVITRLLTPEEAECINILATAWNSFLKLPRLHPWEETQFMHAIHAAQYIIMARPTMRNQHETHEEEDITLKE